MKKSLKEAKEKFGEEYEVLKSDFNNMYIDLRNTIKNDFLKGFLLNLKDLRASKKEINSKVVNIKHNIEERKYKNKESVNKFFDIIISNFVGYLDYVDKIKNKEDFIRIMEKEEISGPQELSDFCIKMRKQFPSAVSTISFLAFLIDKKWAFVLDDRLRGFFEDNKIPKVWKGKKRSKFEEILKEFKNICKDISVEDMMEARYYMVRYGEERKGEEESREILALNLAWNNNNWRGWDKEGFHKFHKDKEYRKKMGAGDFPKKYGFGHEWWNFYDFKGDEYFYGYYYQPGKPKVKEYPVVLFFSKNPMDKDNEDRYFVGFYGNSVIEEGKVVSQKKLKELIPEEDKEKLKEILEEKDKELVEDYENDKEFEYKYRIKGRKEFSTYLKEKINFKEVETKEELRLPGSGPRYYTIDTAKILLKKALNKHENKLKEIKDENEKKEYEIIIEKIKKVLNILNEGGEEMNKKSMLNLYFQSKNFHFQPHQISSFYTALKTKGFVILAGLSGTGKTKMAQLFGELFGKDKVEFLPVRPDWKDSKSLIGYYNPIMNRYESTPLFEFILKAIADYKENKQNTSPYFVILDEMNLARVEYYFADFLSILESGRDEEGFTKEGIKIQITGENPQKQEEKQKELFDLLEKAKIDYKSPSPNPSHQGREEYKTYIELKLPPNLYFIGTVNIDETTFMFSPKVLDRAFTIEFKEVDFDKYKPFAPEFLMISNWEGHFDEIKDSYYWEEKIYDLDVSQIITVEKAPALFIKVNKENKKFEKAWMGYIFNFRKTREKRGEEEKPSIRFEIENSTLEELKDKWESLAESLYNNINTVGWFNYKKELEKWTKNFSGTIKQDFSNYGKFIISYSMKDSISDALTMLKSSEKFYDRLKNLSTILKPYNLHFAYRVLDEIALFYKNAKEAKKNKIVSFKNDDEIIDLAVLMKVLPKFHGSRAKLEEPLWRVLNWCLNPSEEIKEIDKKKIWNKIKEEEKEPGPQDIINLLEKFKEFKNKFKFHHTAKKVLEMLYKLHTDGYTGYL